MDGGGLEPNSGEDAGHMGDVQNHVGVDVG